MNEEKANNTQRPEQETESQTGAGGAPQGSNPVLPASKQAGQELPNSRPRVAPGSEEEQIKEALRQVFDPAIGLEVIQLGLIREISLADPAEVKMMLTTPFCPYGGWLIQQVKDIAESVSGKQIKINILPDIWDPSLMEDPGLLAGW